jgi:hypothetical protein
MSKIKGFLKKRQLRKNVSSLNCPSCKSSLYKNGDEHIIGCLCFGFASNDPKAKIAITKNENGVSLDFNKSWEEEQIELLIKVIAKSK